MRLNDLDERIVHALAEDARRSYADIGQEVGLSAPAVKRRVDRLRADGAITGFTVRVDPAALGWETEGYIEIYCRRNTSPESIHRGLSRYPEVGGGGPPAPGGGGAPPAPPGRGPPRGPPGPPPRPPTGPGP
ncbi:Lrp/AsnC family transcriptional regulator, partial [Streptomyces sp. NPDC059008]|uniref:Lrp/AsnC family transcriptional regulator n=1 Tax=Streptomyces sp. NPDC059008 TaxID=3346693 RepID=UPI00369B48F1